GGAGFIGSHLVESLIEKGTKITIVDNFSTGRLSNLQQVSNQFTLVNADIGELDIGSVGVFDACIHLAAQTSVPLSVDNFKSSSLDNLSGTINVIDFCRTHHLPLVYASSSAVYGNLEHGCDDDEQMDLISPYAVDKCVMETYARMAHSLYGLRSLGLRFFNVYGPRQDPSSPYSGVISIFLDRLLNDKPLTINGGYQTRDFIYVADVVRAIECSLDLLKTQNICEVSNVLTGTSITIETLVEVISTLTNKTPQLVHLPLPLGDPEKSGGSTTRMTNLLGIDASLLMNIEEGLYSTLGYILNER
ncbi:MAG: NAD-dependent epimerase/dehydratase family protein, partial [Allomuricauda sp.]